MTKSAFLIVVDVQKDFVDGSLGTSEAREMYPRLLDKVRNFKGRVQI
ncbi:MAG TPA: amidase, partial [Candidatus Avisuccinivibrio pullicola]|nr:amidase [Candidatus Avisuccinivibrio pullicola]